MVANWRCDDNNTSADWGYNPAYRFRVIHHGMETDNGRDAAHE